MQVKRLVIGFLSLFLAVAGANFASAKGGELKFHSIVEAVTQDGENLGSIDVTIHGVVVPIIINGDTEIEGDGEEFGLADVEAGDFVRVSAFFSDEGLVADEVSVLEARDQQFRLRGNLTAVGELDGATVLTLLGVDVLATEDTDITQRGSGRGNDVPAADLAVGDVVNVVGILEDDTLVAVRIHVGTREQGNIELEGEVESVSDAGITISIEGGISVTIVTDDDTSIVGELLEGTFVEVEGQLLEDLSLLAFVIVADEDGDGDADDDNRRGRRGDINSIFGLCKKLLPRNDLCSRLEDDDDGDGSTIEVVRVGAETALSADGLEIRGFVEYSYVEEGDEVEQEFELEVEDADPETEYGLVLLFGDTEVEVGAFTADAEGELEVKLKSGTADADIVLEDMIPEGSDLRDLTGVQITQDGEVILEGDFGGADSP